MTFQRLLAQLTVSDLDRSEEWCTRLFGGAPDARPMDGLIEWHLSESFGVQVFCEPDRAGHSSIVLDESDLDGLAARLTDAGVAHDGVRKATRVRILPLVDPDGNRVVFSGPLES